VVDERHQHGFHHAADGGRGQLTDEQQIDRFAERQAAHHLVERVSAYQNLVRLDGRQRRAPSVLAGPRLRSTFHHGGLLKGAISSLHVVP
jgi:hypothetical protein